MTVKAIVHSSLELRTLIAAHLVMRDNVTGLIRSITHNFFNASTN